MSSNILNMIKNKREEEALLLHPVVDKELDIKMYYLQGISLMMNVDEDIHEKEKDYLFELIKLFGLDEFVMEELIAFATEPDKVMFGQIMEKIGTDEALKKFFMLDVLLTAKKDGILHANEKKLQDIYFETLSFETNERQKLQTIANIVDEQDEEGALVFYLSDREFYDNFTYLFAFLGFNCEKLSIAVASANKAVIITKIVKDVLLDFSYIPTGTFLMGSPKSEIDEIQYKLELSKSFFGLPMNKAVENITMGLLNSETDAIQHEVTISKGFEMMTTPITQALWEAVMGNNPSQFKGADLPVEQVSWKDVKNFIKKLNKIIGGVYIYRLPTEAEWEYACRAGSTTPFWTGNYLTTNQANYDGNSKSLYRAKTTRVREFKSNAWGLYNMHGNVFEWCEDWYGDYPSGNVTDPVGPSTGSVRVVRGGGWNSRLRDCRSAYRGGYSPDNHHYFIGARLCRSFS